MEKADGPLWQTSGLLQFAKRNLGLLLFAVMAIISLFGYADYGISWDEPQQRKTGLVNYEYVFNDNQELLEYKDRDYGVGFELPLIILEKKLGLTDSREIYLMRHFVSHLFFLLGGFFFFRLVDLLYRNKILATIAFFLLVLHPLLYAHSFFNSKDIPFMSMFVIAFYFTARAFTNKSVSNFILMGIAIGLLINLRIMGVLILACVIPFLIYDGIRSKRYLQNTIFVGALLCSSILVLYASWPFLWKAPVQNFMEAFNNMSHFRWFGLILTNGQWLEATDLPWYYIPLWFSVTTPIFNLLVIATGILLLIFQFVKSPLRFIDNTAERNNLIYFVCGFLAVVAVIVLNSVLYDSWRQMYFIYPPLILLGIYGLHVLYRKNFRYVIIFLATASFIATGIFMVRNHPFEHVYFNELIDKNEKEYIRHNYLMDYWGTSYKQALEFILDHDPSANIYFAAANTPGVINMDILPKNQRFRLVPVPYDEADYFITNFRSKSDYDDSLAENEYHSIKVGNNTINRTYKLEPKKDHNVRELFSLNMDHLEVSKHEEFKSLLEFKLPTAVDRMSLTVKFDLSDSKIDPFLDDHAMLVLHILNENEETVDWKGYRIGTDLPTDGIVHFREIYDTDSGILLPSGTTLKAYIWNQSKLDLLYVFNNIEITAKAL